MTPNYKTYQQTLKKNFSKIPLIFQENNYLPTEDIYIELALSDSASGQAKYPKYLFHIELKKFIDEVARFENLE